MIASFINLKNFKKRGRVQCLFLILSKLHSLAYRLPYVFSLNMVFFFNARLFFFFKVYKTFFSVFFSNGYIRSRSRSILFYLTAGNSTNCFSNIYNKFNKSFTKNYIIHTIRLRNFFLCHLTKKSAFYISAGMGSNYGIGGSLRRVRFSNDNFVKRVRMLFGGIFKRLRPFLTLIYNSMSRRIVLSLKTYFILFKLLHKFLKVKWLKISQIIIRRRRIYGFMRGEKKPTRKKKITKRFRRCYY